LLVNATFSPYPKNPLLAKFFIELGWVDRLGSGVLNVNKFIKQYAGKESDPPQFVEDTIFKAVIPIPVTVGVIDGTIDGAIEATIKGVIKDISNSVKDRLLNLMKIIYNNPGIKNVELQVILNVSERTITSDIKRLKDFIKYEGSQKGGGYFLNDEFKNELDKKPKE